MKTETKTSAPKSDGPIDAKHTVETRLSVILG